jgi:hypothetical protein
MKFENLIKTLALLLHSSEQFEEIENSYTRDAYEILVTLKNFRFGRQSLRNYFSPIKVLL